MLEGKLAPLRLRVLVVDDELTHDTAEGRAARLLVSDIEGVTSTSFKPSPLPTAWRL